MIDLIKGILFHFVYIALVVAGQKHVSNHWTGILLLYLSPFSQTCLITDNDLRDMPNLIWSQRYTITSESYRIIDNLCINVIFVWHAMCFILDFYHSNCLRLLTVSTPQPFEKDLNMSFNTSKPFKGIHIVYLWARLVRQRNYDVISNY